MLMYIYKIYLKHHTLKITMNNYKTRQLISRCEIGDFEIANLFGYDVKVFSYYKKHVLKWAREKSLISNKQSESGKWLISKNRMDLIRYFLNLVKFRGFGKGVCKTLTIDIGLSKRKGTISRQSNPNVFRFNGLD